MRFIQVDPPTTAALAAERHHRFIADVRHAPDRPACAARHERRAGENRTNTRALE